MSGYVPAVPRTYPPADNDRGMSIFSIWLRPLRRVGRHGLTHRTARLRIDPLLWQECGWPLIFTSYLCDVAVPSCLALDQAVCMCVDHGRAAEQPGRYFYGGRSWNPREGADVDGVEFRALSAGQVARGLLNTGQSILLIS
jgi:hypothetical protein